MVRRLEAEHEGSLNSFSSIDIQALKADTTDLQTQYAAACKTQLKPSKHRSCAMISQTSHPLLAALLPIDVTVL